MSKKYKPIPIERESSPDDRVEEKCCFCWEATTFWTDIKTRRPEQQVACCVICCEEYRQIDVPTKKYWFLVAGIITQESGKAFVGGRRSMLKETYDRQQQLKKDAGLITQDG